MTGLIAAEWLKTRSLRSTWWALGLTTAAVLGASALDRDGAFPLAGYLMLIVVATGSGAAAMVGEYSSGLIRATTVAVPSRAELIMAKAVVLATYWTVAGALIAVGSYATAQSPGPMPGATAFVAAALVAPVCALVGLGLAVVLRHAGATYVTGVLLVVLAPQMFGGNHDSTRAVNHAMIVPAWERLTLAHGSPEAVGAAYTTATEAWLVYALWPLLAVAAAVLAHHWRDV
ncbi:hypothetical protein [Actinoplanes sp. NPDC051851]|uniref:hypothetical protein n=1 Tax=Actinoplanes sp. NPDC051851 TaxID=3154753 RepID=UPI00343E696D